MPAPFPPRRAPSAVSSRLYPQQGSRRGDGSGSYLVTSRQTQPRKEKLAVLGVPELAKVRHHDRGDRPQPRDNFARFFEPTHVRVTRGENAIRLRERWIFLDREAQFRHGLVEAPAAETSEAHHEEGGADTRARTEPQRDFAMLDRDVGLTRLQPEHTADVPSTRVIRVELQGTIDYRHQRA